MGIKWAVKVLTLTEMGILLAPPTQNGLNVKGLIGPFKNLFHQRDF